MPGFPKPPKGYLARLIACVYTSPVSPGGLSGGIYLPSARHKQQTKRNNGNNNDNESYSDSDNDSVEGRGWEGRRLAGPLLNLSLSLLWLGTKVSFVRPFPSHHA